MIRVMTITAWYRVSEEFIELQNIHFDMRLMNHKNVPFDKSPALQFRSWNHEERITLAGTTST